MVDKNNNGMNGRYGWLIDNLIISSVVNVGINENAFDDANSISVYRNPLNDLITVNNNVRLNTIYI